MFGLGCQVEVFVKIQKKNLFFFGGGGSGRGVRVDVTKLKFLRKFTKKQNRGWGESGWWGGGGQGGCERNVWGMGDVNQE